MDSNDTLRSIARKRVAERRGFQLHLVVYLLVNGALWAFWFLVSPASEAAIPWPAFVAVGWGIGLVAHGLWTYWYLSGADDEAVEQELRRLSGEGGGRRAG